MKQYYECHITIDDPAVFNQLEKDVESIGWTFSSIDGDPDLGRGVKSYATKHFNLRKSREKVIEELTEAARFLREEGGYKVLREKVELVIYDKRAR